MKTTKTHLPFRAIARAASTLAIVASVAFPSANGFAAADGLATGHTLAGAGSIAAQAVVPAVGAAGGSSLESAANKAGEVGRKVAMSLIALGFAVAAVMLVFRRDFKEAVGVFAVGLVAIVLATPAGVDVLRNTVSSLFGS